MVKLFIHRKTQRGFGKKPYQRRFYFENKYYFAGTRVKSDWIWVQRLWLSIFFGFAPLMRFYEASESSEFGKKCISKTIKCNLGDAGTFAEAHHFLCSATVEGGRCKMSQLRPLRCMRFVLIFHNFRINTTQGFVRTSLNYILSSYRTKIIFVIPTVVPIKYSTTLQIAM